MKRVVGIIARIFGYGALIIVVAGFAALAIVSNSGACPSFTEARVACNSPFYQGLAEFAMGVVLASVFTGLPILLALMGFIFLIVDWRRWRRRTPPPSIL